MPILNFLLLVSIELTQSSGLPLMTLDASCLSTFLLFTQFALNVKCNIQEVEFFRIIIRPSIYLQHKA